MWSPWNWIGVGAWLVLIIYLIFIVHNIRKRRLKMLVTRHKRFSGGNFAIDLVLVLLFLVGMTTMSYLTFFRQVALTDHDDVTISYTYRPLVLQTQGGQGYFVQAHNGTGKAPTQRYTYWTEGARYQITNQNATVSSGKRILNVEASAYPWQQKTLDKWEKATRSAFVVTLHGRYTENLLNGLGLEAGRQAIYYQLIRVPDDIFVKVDNPRD